MKKYFFLFIIPILYSGCCGDWEDILYGDSEICESQIFTETQKRKLKFEYTVADNKKFIIAQELTADKIRKALGVPEGENFTLKSIDITSGTLNYSRHPDNTCAALNVNFAIVGNTFNQLLLFKKDEVLPLIDIPYIPFVSEGLKINDYLSTDAIPELRKLLKDYVNLLNNDGLSFLLIGEGEPKLFYTHFTLYFNLNITIVYEVCRFVPLGKGERPCD